MSFKRAVPALVLYDSAGIEVRWEYLTDVGLRLTLPVTAAPGVEGVNRADTDPVDDDACELSHPEFQIS